MWLKAAQTWEEMLPFPVAETAGFSPSLLTRPTEILSHESQVDPTSQRTAGILTTFTWATSQKPWSAETMAPGNIHISREFVRGREQKWTSRRKQTPPAPLASSPRESPFWTKLKNWEVSCKKGTGLKTEQGVSKRGMWIVCEYLCGSIAWLGEGKEHVPGVWRPGLLSYMCHCLILGKLLLHVGSWEQICVSPICIS